MTSLIIVETEPAFVSKAQSLAGEAQGLGDVASVAGLSEAEGILAERPSIILIGPSVALEDAITFCRKQTILRPETPILIARLEVGTEVLREALRAGARDVLPVPLDKMELLAAVERARGFFEKLSPGGIDGDWSGPSSARRAQFVTLFSAKGGVGKTLIATNIAIALASQRPGSVILVDLDLQFGDVGVMLQMLPERTVYDVVQSIERLDASMMKKFLTSHERGLDVLLAPVHPDLAEDIGPDQLKTVLMTLRDMSDLVILDTAASFSNVALISMDLADQIYVVATLDAPCIKDTKLALETMHRLGYPDEKIRVVLNRSDSKVGLTVRDVEDALELRIAATVPSDRLVPRTINRGVPIVIDAPRSGVARSLFALAELVKGAMAPVKMAA